MTARFFEIGYAYPSSTLAMSMGAGSTGCYVLHKVAAPAVYIPGSKVEGPFTSWYDAHVAARETGLPPSKCTSHEQGSLASQDGRIRRAAVELETAIVERAAKNYDAATTANLYGILARVVRKPPKGAPSEMITEQQLRQWTDAARSSK